jgi:hypothetical protein
MREVAAFLGVNREIQVSGMMSVEACAGVDGAKCDYVNVPWSYKWGDPLSITVKRPPPPDAPKPNNSKRKKPKDKKPKRPKRKKPKR